MHFITHNNCEVGGIYTVLTDEKIEAQRVEVT